MFFVYRQLTNQGNEYNFVLDLISDAIWDSVVIELHSITCMKVFMQINKDSNNIIIIMSLSKEDNIFSASTSS